MGGLVPTAGASAAPLVEQIPVARRVATAALLLLGLGAWAALGMGRGMGPARWAIVAIAGAMALTPPIARHLGRAQQALPVARARTAVLVGLGAAAYLLLTAWLQGRDWFPKTEDEGSYLLGAQMMAHGRLWTAALPLRDFFDSFYILTQPVYCSIYFPGTALMFAPAIGLGLPTWAMPVMAAGAAVGLLYHIVAELVDAGAGLLAALLVVSLTWFRTYSTLLVSQMPMLLLGLVIVWAWLRWRRSRRWGWAIAIGAAAGWAAITRPVDALCYALPVGAAMLAWPMGPTRGRLARIALALVAGACPFMALQITFDLGVTGHPFTTPYADYLAREQPGAAYGIRPFDPHLHPASDLPQIRDYYRWCQGYFARHQPDNFLRPWLSAQQLDGGSTRPSYISMIVDTTMPSRILLPLAAAGIVGLFDRRGRAVLAATLPLFVALYLFNPFFLEHYAIAVIPAMALLIVLGIEALGRAWPRWAVQIRAGTTAVVAAVCVTSLWEINRWIAPAGQQVDDETFRSPMLHAINVEYPSASDFRTPAVILFRYRPGDNFFQEPVYNSGVVRPDEAAIVRAHDLGPQRDRAIVEYYASRQPERTFYLFDARSPEPMRMLGPASRPADVLRALDEARGTSPGGARPD